MALHRIIIGSRIIKNYVFIVQLEQNSWEKRKWQLPASNHAVVLVRFKSDAWEDPVSIQQNRWENLSI